MTQDPVQPDNFEAIDGIGSKRSKWLQEEFGVRTYGELALLPVDEIQDRLRDFEKRSPKQGEVASWIIAAAELALQQGQLSDEPKTAKSTEWSAVAHFQVVVEEQAESDLYRTQVIHEESLEKIPLDGISILAAASWMLDKLNILTVGTPALEAMQMSSEAPSQMMSATQDMPAGVLAEEPPDVDEISTQAVLAKINALKGKIADRPMDEPLETEPFEADEVSTRRILAKINALKGDVANPAESDPFSEGMQHIMDKIARLKNR